MGATLSTELGDEALAALVQDTLQEVHLRLRADDPALPDVALPNHAIGDTELADAADCLGSARHVRLLDLSYNAVGPTGCRAVCHALSKSPSNLRVLRLSGNPLGRAGCRAVCEYLELTLHRATLEELYLYHCGLDDECVLMLANVLQRHTGVRALNLDMNPVSGRAAKILLELLRRNDTIAELSCAPLDAVRVNPSVQAELDERVAANAAVLAAQASAVASREQREADRSAQRADAEARRERMLQEERARVSEELAGLEAQKAEEERRVAELEASVAGKLASRRARVEERAERRQEELERAVRGAFEWRAKLTGYGTLQKEWRSGFTVLKSEPGSVGGVPTIAAENPRRLRACWCDPHEAAVPYAKRLHYHCKHERPLAEMKDAEGEPLPYEGCAGSGHVCATVGYYAKPKADLSAAHFFGSKAPGPASTIS